MKNSKIFLLAGTARSGKDTVGTIISDYYEKKGLKVVKLGFADYIKLYAKKITGWDGSDATKPRDLLQQLGTDVVREKINKDFFINRICEDILVYKYYFDIIIITGARFPNELDIPKKRFDNLYITYVKRPKYVNGLTKTQKAHISEHALDNYSNYDFLIVNEGDILELKNNVYKMLDEV